MTGRAARMTALAGLGWLTLLAVAIPCIYQPTEKQYQQIQMEFLRRDGAGHERVVELGYDWFSRNAALPESPTVAKLWLAALARTGREREAGRWAARFAVLYADQDRQGVFAYYAARYGQ